MRLDRSSFMWLALIVAGCGGAALSGSGMIRVEAPWDRPLPAPPTQPATMHWAIGEVSEVSLDGSTVMVKLKRGTLSRGKKVGIYFASHENPSPHYMWDEARELLVAQATISATVGDRCEAQIFNLSSNTPVSVGDKVIELVP